MKRPDGKTSLFLSLTLFAGLAGSAFLLVHRNDVTTRPSDERREHASSVTDNPESARAVSLNKHADHNQASRRLPSSTGSTANSKTAAAGTLISDRSAEFFRASSRPWQVLTQDEHAAYFAEGRFRVGGSDTALTDFLRDYGHALFGAAPDSIVLERESHEARPRSIFRQLIDAKPVYGASLVIVREGDEIVQMQNDLVREDITRTREAARQTFEEACGAYRAACLNTEHQVIWFASRGRLVPVYDVTFAEPGEFPYRRLISAVDGRTVKKISMIVR